MTSGGVGDVDPTRQELRIAGRQAHDIVRFNGLLDEVAIWSRPLSAYEVGRLYNGDAGLALGDGVGFDPATLGPELWLDAADAATVLAVARNDLRRNYNGLFSLRASTSVRERLALEAYLARKWGL